MLPSLHLKTKPSEDDMRRMYETEFMSAVKISKKLKVSDVTVFRWLRHYGIRIRTSTESRPAKPRPIVTIGADEISRRAAIAKRGGEIIRARARRRHALLIGTRVGNVIIENISYERG